MDTSPMASQDSLRLADTVSVAPVISPEVSVVIPCLNEADTLATCIEKASAALRESGISGEVIVADNGSTRRIPVDIAERLGARVVRVEARGYGNALMDGIAAARGSLHRDGRRRRQLRLPRRAGLRREAAPGIRPGAGLPAAAGRRHDPARRHAASSTAGRATRVLSWIARRWFRAPIHDVYCGLRGFTRSPTGRLEQRCTGMEFATEMIVKVEPERGADRRGPHHAATPTAGGAPSASPDLPGRLANAAVLPPLQPAAGCSCCRARCCCFSARSATCSRCPGSRFAGVTFDAHTLLFASLAILCGYQAIQFATISKAFAIGAGLIPDAPRLTASADPRRAGAWAPDRPRRAGPGRRAAARRRRAVAGGRLRPSGLQPDDALGDSRARR